MSDLIEQIIRLFTLSDANVRYVLAGMALLGLTSGVLGSFTLLKKRALIGDALAHAALPGIAGAFLLTGTKSLGVLFTGAFIAGLLGVAAHTAIRRTSRIKEDSSLALVLTVFFGVGIVLLTHIQKLGSGNQSGLDKFLFGQSASLVGGEVKLIGAVGLVLLVIVALLYKEFKLVSFDPEYGRSLGYSIGVVDGILLALTVAAVVIGLQAVGVVLMAALLIIPAASARLWAKSLLPMIIAAGVIGFVSGLAGAAASFLAPRMPSGPLTVMAATALFLISLAFAPERGLISRMLRDIDNRRRTRKENVLRAIVELTETAGSGVGQLLDFDELAKYRGWELPSLKRTIRLLEKGGLAKVSDDFITLTHNGVTEAHRLVRRHRLWELYLMHQAEIPADHVDRDADENEHYLTPEMEARLLELTGIEEKIPASPHSLRG